MSCWRVWLQCVMLLEIRTTTLRVSPRRSPLAVVVEIIGISNLRLEYSIELWFLLEPDRIISINDIHLFVISADKTLFNVL